MSAPCLALSLGDPSGIGPEIVVQALAAVPESVRRDVVVFGDAGALQAAGGLPPGVSLTSVTALSASDRRPGVPTPEGGRAQLAYLQAALEWVRASGGRGLVTAPIHKGQIRSAGFAFPGHTEYLGAAFGAEPVMMFAGPRLRVALVTTHIPHAGVSAALRESEIARITCALAQACVRDFGIASPRVGVVGLNPHAGEDGLFGDEEPRILVPGIARARALIAAPRSGIAGAGVVIGGPLVPDAAFRSAVEGRWDALVALYHDQALIPVKLMDFEDAVNVTLELPIVRTSPDHGVAYDIAGKRLARPTSLRQALTLAHSMVKRRLPK